VSSVRGGLARVVRLGVGGAWVVWGPMVWWFFFCGLFFLVVLRKAGGLDGPPYTRAGARLLSPLKVGRVLGWGLFLVMVGRVLGWGVFLVMVGRATGAANRRGGGGALRSCG
jgi:hypothetical protein